MFTKKNVITAKFINEEHTVIEVLTNIKDTVHSYALEYDKDSADFQALEKAGWDLERVTEETAGYKRDSSRIHNESIEAAADEILKEDRKAIKEEWDKLKEQWTKTGISSEELKQQWAKADQALGKAEVKRQEAITDIVGTIIANNEDEDMLFKAKLAAMELDIVKASKKTKSKQEIRKAKSLMEVISTLYKL
jgi:hypothetical protein